jgi:antitoxin component YwqK of YwqJK toxin-antitoxin module
MKQLLVFVMLLAHFVCQGQTNSFMNIDYNDIFELKGVFYLKTDTTLVTGRVIRYNKKKEAKRYVFITEGKPDNLGWTQFKNNYESPKESTLGTLLNGAAFVTAAAMALSGSADNIPVGDFNNSNSTKGYIKEQKANTSKTYQEMSERNDISRKLNVQKEGSAAFSDNSSNDLLIETKGNYINEKKDGVWETYYSNEILKSKGVYSEGVRDGLWLEYHDNGELENEVNYNMGKKEGLMKVYQANSLLKARINYKDGMEDGVSEFYDEHGQIELKVNYKEGKENGTLEHYMNGQLVKIEFWKDGVLVNN